jgi:hypothetical protein
MVRADHAFSHVAIYKPARCGLHGQVESVELRAAFLDQAQLLVYVMAARPAALR